MVIRKGGALLLVAILLIAGIFGAAKAMRQVITAAADGANCVASAEKYLLENRG